MTISTNPNESETEPPSLPFENFVPLPLQSPTRGRDGEEYGPCRQEKSHSSLSGLLQATESQKDLAFAAYVAK